MMLGRTTTRAKPHRRAKRAVLCGCGRVGRYQRSEGFSLAVALVTTAAAMTLAATGGPWPPAALVAAMAATSYVHAIFTIAELAGTGFCSACTEQNTPGRRTQSASASSAVDGGWKPSWGVNDSERWPSSSVSTSTTMI